MINFLQILLRSFPEHSANPFWFLQCLWLTAHVGGWPSWAADLCVLDSPGVLKAESSALSPQLPCVLLYRSPFLYHRDVFWKIREEKQQHKKGVLLALIKLKHFCDSKS